jgi:hypothetical protein
MIGFRNTRKDVVVSVQFLDVGVEIDQVIVMELRLGESADELPFSHCNAHTLNSISRSRFSDSSPNCVIGKGASIVFKSG